MPRETSHLFVAWVESLLLTIICLSIASGIGLFGVTGLAAWAFIVQASTFAPTLIVHMVFFTSEKRHEIRGDNALADGRVGRLDVAYVTTVSNAYCGVLSTVLLYVLSMYLQAIHFGSTIPDDQSWRVRGPDAFITTKRLDWSQATIGASSWVKTGKAYGDGLAEFHSTQSNLVGLGALGIVQGYVLVMLLVAMYTAYTSTPEGAFNPLFMDSRMLTVTNAFIAIGGDGMVTGVFAGCGGVADSGFPIFIVFAAAVCYDEYAIWLLLTPINRSMHGKLYVRGILQPMMLSVAAVCPLLYCFLVGYAAPMKIASSILSVLSIATGWARFMIVVHGDIPPQDRKPSQSLREEQVPKRPLEDKKLARPPPPPSNPSPRPPPFNPSVGPTPNSSGMRALFSMAQPLHYDGRAKNA